jgi:hypothetical protein
VSCFGFVASLNTFVSTPTSVRVIDGVKRSGPNRKRAVSAGSRGELSAGPEPIAGVAAAAMSNSIAIRLKINDVTRTLGRR